MMPGTWRFRPLAAFVVTSVLHAGAAAAQESVRPRVSADTVVSASMLSGASRPGAMVDATVAVDLGHGLTAIARPWAWRRPNATATFQWYQLQLRYQSRSRLPVRVDAGIITSPLGLGTLQQRADLNPTISTIPYYVGRLPRFELTFDDLQMMSAGYPLGAIVTTSGARWDVRGGVTDSTPARPRAALEDGQRPAMAQVIAGGGISPRAGMRIGLGLARGGYRKAAPGVPRGIATVLNLEAEYTINQTRLSGEWVQNRFSSSVTSSTARAFYAQMVQTITPRLFGAARLARIDPPRLFPDGSETDRRIAEFTAGYRLTREWTLRGGYLRERGYLTNVWDNQAAVSVVWAKRWY
jgi:hypothetical protein